MNSVYLTLLSVIAMTGFALGCAWTFTALVGRTYADSTARFAVANFAMGVGVLLVAQRNEVPNFLFFQVGDWLMVASLMLFRNGTRLLVKWPASLLARLAPLGLLMVATAFLEPSLESRLPRGIAITMVALWLAFDMTLACDRGLRTDKFSKWTRLAIIGALSLAILFFIVRFLWLLFTGQGLQTPAMERSDAFLAVLWAVLVMLLVNNLSVAALAGTRLVLRIHFLAERDHLTRCWNRRKMDAYMASEWQRIQRTGDALSCLFFDLDHFKRINDTYGHTAGDAALKHAVQVVQRHLSPLHILGRYGGEEFLVLLPGQPLEQAAQLAEVIRAALQDTPLHVGAQAIELTASFGVASLTPQEAVQSLVSRADAAMYTAKGAGRNQVQRAPQMPL